MPPALLRFWQLDPDLEPAFRRSQQAASCRAFTAWCGLLVAVCLAFFLLVLTNYLQGNDSWTTVILPAVLIGYFTLLLLVQNYTQVGFRGPFFVLPLSCVLIIACSAGHVYLTLGDHVARSLQGRLSATWDALSSNPTAQAELTSYVTDTGFHELCLAAMLVQYTLLDGLRLVGGSRWGLPLHMLPLVATGLLCTAAELRRGRCADLLVTTALASTYTLCSDFHMRCVLRSEFWQRHQLQQSLSAEAQALQRAREAEVAHKEAALKADGMLHHILKNIMADARGCIDMYLEGGQRFTAHLERGRACLERGMQWCMKRLVLMQIASGSYQPACTPTDLKEFGVALIRGRHIHAELLHLMVSLDPLLCNVVLDNAITNALRHSHPDDPQVTFSITCHLLSDQDETEEDNRRLIVFRVTNRADPARPAITPDFLQERLTGQELPPHAPASPLPNGLGLQHLWLAAAAHDMQLSLRQVGETVIFEASVAVAVCDPIDKDSAAPSQHLIASPSAGLHVYCLDDSEMARRLLLHCLQVHLHQAKPRVFGATVDEVDGFVSAALLDADIVILDQHLEYDTATMFGTDVVRRLLENGFTGFVVMRSANSDDHHRAHYQRCGAHLTVGKDVPGRELVAQVHNAYRQFLRTQARGCHLPAASLVPPTITSRRPEATVWSVSRLLDMESCPAASYGPSTKYPTSEVAEPDRDVRSEWDSATNAPGVVRCSPDFLAPINRHLSLRSAALLSETLFDTFTPPLH
eukprot:EG_transcript_4303